jgi:hypothetical protein
MKNTFTKFAQRWAKKYPAISSKVSFRASELFDYSTTFTGATSLLVSIFTCSITR